MATNVIMPALGMAQETGVLVNWLKREGELVTKGEPLIEIETDKATVELEAAASGLLKGIAAREGDVVPVGQTIAWILQPGESVPTPTSTNLRSDPKTNDHIPDNGSKPQPLKVDFGKTSVDASPVARNIAEENGVDLSLISVLGRRIEKADVLAYIQGQKKAAEENPSTRKPSADIPNRILASPKARRLAAEKGLTLAGISGTGPEGAILANDVINLSAPLESTRVETPGTVWRLMAEHMTQSWTTVPHFYLIREVEASNLVEWRKHITPLMEKKIGVKPTYTDLLVKLIAVALLEHPRLNSEWSEAGIIWNQEVNIGIATAVEQGLVVPVIHAASKATLGEIATQRQGLIERAQNRKLRPADISGGTFTLSNLGMYKVDAFNAIVNTPQAAILAVGRIADRVVPVNGQAMVRPMMVITLSCDHRVVDGARAAQFLDYLSNLIEDPLRMLV
jgi:pyruvate dehydrogenase E2 component (dihydrolipoamide acetyltransferase)